MGDTSSEQAADVQGSKLRSKAVWLMCIISVTFVSITFQDLSLRRTSNIASMDASDATVDDSENDNDNSHPLLLPPEVVNPYVLIGGKSYSLDELDMNGKPFAENPSEEALELDALLPLPKPIIVVGMPKAGTFSIFDFFKNSGHKAVHWAPPGWNHAKKVGNCMRKAAEAGKPLLRSCGNYEVWAQIDVTDPQLWPESSCHYPQMTNLPQIHQEAPNATFILNRRDFSSWADSVHRWGSMRNRMPKCTPFGPKSSSKQDLMQWHKDQVQRVRQFVKEHPSHALIEVDIEHAASAMRMSKAFQIDVKYWGKSNAN